MAQFLKTLNPDWHPLKLNTQLALAILAISISPRMDQFIQWYTSVLVLVLFTLFCGEVIPTANRPSLFYVLFGIDFILIIAIGTFLVPAYGKLAIGFRWQALLITLALVDLLVYGFSFAYIEELIKAEQVKLKRFPNLAKPLLEAQMRKLGWFKVIVKVLIPLVLVGFQIVFVLLLWIFQ